MSIDYQRIYYNTLFGALGGLVAWLVTGLFLNINTSSFFLLLLKDALLGISIGVCIGGALGAVDGLTISRSMKRLRRGSALGAVIGLLGGLTGVVIGELIFRLAGGGVWSRAIGWAFFGLLVGMSEGRAEKSAAKIRYGAVGGLLGGLIGGSTYERLSVLLRFLTHDREFALTVGSAIGLIILGASIGSLIGLVEDILRQAWVRVVVGPLEGYSFSLIRQETRLGRAEEGEIVLPEDTSIQPRHALIQQTQTGFTLEPLAQPVLLNQQPLTQPAALKNGDRIQLGHTQLIFQIEGGQP